MAAFVMGDWAEGGRCAGVGNVLHHGGSDGAPLRVKVVGYVPADWEGDGRI